MGRRCKQILKTSWFYLALLATLPPVAEVSSLSSTPTKKLRTAFCVVGAVRTLTEPNVYNSLYRYISRTSTDLHFYLFVGRELSFRGMPQTTEATELLKALAGATTVRIQTEENTFPCGQMTLGKLFKLQQCAKQVEAWSKASSTDYDIFLYTRPDLKYHQITKLPQIMEGTVPHPFILNFVWKGMTNNEMKAMSYNPGIDFAKNVTAARCCDVKKRFPTECFLKGREAPKANYIIDRHFQNVGQPRKSLLGSFIKRPKDFKIITHNASFQALHGKVRDDVVSHDRPVVSEVMNNWKTFNRTTQLEWLRSVLKQQVVHAPAPSRR